MSKKNKRPNAKEMIENGTAHVVELGEAFLKMWAEDETFHVKGNIAGNQIWKEFSNYAKAVSFQNKTIKGLIEA